MPIVSERNQSCKPTGFSRGYLTEFRAFAKRMEKKYGLGKQVFGGIVGTKPTKKKKKGNKPRGR